MTYLYFIIYNLWLQLSCVIVAVHIKTMIYCIILIIK